MEQLIIGTAGHVDHGKTVLIKALTGVDTDRLREEKERGISIDLGFAPFRLPSGRLAGVVDVPGHERFIHNMLAGAAGLDLVMLVVDASEGVMTQTREHLDILQLLGIANGIVVITKIDLVEEEWQELVREEIREELKNTFLQDAPIIAVSALKGQGIAELKSLIDELTAGLEPKSATGPLRLPVDRSFVISGFGTVITGTLIQGTVRVGETVAVVPPAVEARVRNIQIHDSDVKEARAGSRVALNLSGLEKSQIQRGSVVSSPDYYRQTSLVDLSVELLASAPRRLRNLAPVHFFLGTARSTARLLLLDCDELQPGRSALAQCRLDHPLVAERGDSFVIRSYSPMTTIGGGRVLDPYPARHRRFRAPVIERLRDLQQAPAAGGDAAFVRRKLEELTVAGVARLARETRLAPEKVEQILGELTSGGEVAALGEACMIKTTLADLAAKLEAAVAEHHLSYPLAAGISRARLHGFLPSAFGQREYDALIAHLEAEGRLTARGDLVSASGFRPEPAAGDKKKIETLLGRYSAARLQPPTVKVALEEAGLPYGRREEIYGYLVSEQHLVKITEELYFHREAYAFALDLLRRHFAAEKTLTLAQFRDLTGGSRKFAQALLEHFDQAKYTRRVEDHRVAFKLDREN